MGMGMAVFKITADIQDLLSGLSKGADAVSKFADKVNDISKRLVTLGIQTTVLGATLSGLFAPVIMQGGQFEQTMANVRAVVDELASDLTDSAGKFEALSSEAKRLGETTRYSAVQTAEAMVALGQAGLTSVQIMQSIADTLNLASAGGISMAEAADTAANAMIVFRLAASDTNRVADVLAGTAAATTTDIKGMAESFKYGAPLASSLGQSIEEVSLALGVLANAGQKNTVGGTALASFLDVLVSKSDKVDQALRVYGSSFERVNPAVMSLTEIIKEFQRINFTVADTMAIFDQRAGRGLLALKNATAESMESIRGQLDNFGEASRQAAIKNDTFLGSLAKFKNAISGLGIEVFEAMTTAMRDALEVGQQWIQSMSLWVRMNEELAGKIAAVTVAIGAFVVAAAPVITIISIFTSSISTIVGGLAGLASNILELNPVITTLAAMLGTVLVAAFQAVTENWSSVVSIFQGAYDTVIVPLINGFMGVLTALNETVPVFALMRQQFGTLIVDVAELVRNLDPLKYVFTAIGAAIGAIVAGPLYAFMTLVTTLTTIIDVLVKSVNFWFDGIRAVTDFLGITTAKTNEAAEAAVAQAAALERVIATHKEFVAANKDVEKALVDNTKAYQAEVALLEKSDSLRAVELKTLRDLVKERSISRDAIRDNVIALDKEIDVIQKRLDLLPKTSVEAKELTIILTRLKDARAKDVETSGRLIAVEAKYGEATLRSVDAIEARLKKETERERVLKERAGAIDEAIKHEKEWAKVVEEVTTGKLEGYEEEIRKMEKLRMARQEEAEIQKKAIEARMADVRDPDALNAMKMELDEVNRLKARINEEADTQTARVNKKRKDDRDKLILDNRIQEAKESENKIEAARLEAEKMIAEERKKFDKIFDMTKEEDVKLRAIEEERLKRRADLIVNKAVEDEKKANERKNKEVEKHRDRVKKIEDSITEQLAKQVKSIADMVRLYAAIENIKDRQNRKALAQATEATRAEMLLANMQMRSELNPGDRRLAGQVTLQAQRAAMLRAIADRGAVVQGLNVRPAKGAGANPQEAAAEANRIENIFIAMRDRIRVALVDIGNDFAASPKRWVDAFIAGWEQAGGELTAVIAATMAAIHNLMRPEVRHSPSLIDIWNMNVSTVSKGINKMSNVMMEGAPKLSAINIANRLPSAGMNMGGFQDIAASARTITDNRSANITVNSSFEAANMKRLIGNALNNAYMSVGEV